MSARNRGTQSRAFDSYATPGYVIGPLTRLFRSIPPLIGEASPVFLEPCRGAGAIFDRFKPLAKHYRMRSEWCEIDPMHLRTYANQPRNIPHPRDYLNRTFRRAITLTVTNPPFSLFSQFLLKSIVESRFEYMDHDDPNPRLPMGGTVIYLLPQSAFGSNSRVNFWNQVIPVPTHRIAIAPRPSFYKSAKGSSSDAREYEWVAWDGLGLLKNVPRNYVLHCPKPRRLRKGEES